MFSLDKRQILWLDTNAETIDRHKRHRFSEIQIIRFKNIDECEEYIRHNDHYQIVLIINSPLIPEIISRFNSLRHITSIYIRSLNSDNLDECIPQLKKVK